MALEHALTVSDELVHCTFAGSHVDLEEYRRPFAAILKACKEQGSRKVLFDYRDLQSYPEPSERISILEMWAHAYSAHRKSGGHELVSALLMSGGQIDNVEIPLDTAKNLGFIVHRTTDYDEALSWLASHA